jgi:hypothetical protein
MRDNLLKSCRGRNRIVVGFTTACAINAYHHQSCEFESRLVRCTRYNTYQVSLHLAEGFQMRTLKCEKLTDDMMAKAHITNI